MREGAVRVALTRSVLALLLGAPPALTQERPVPELRRIGPDSHAVLQASQLRGALRRTEGTVAIPVVLGLFSDSQEPTITPETVQQSLFDGPAPRGTLTQAYLEISRGALTVNGDVFPWVRTDIDLMSAVGTTHGLAGDAQAGAYFVQALTLVDPDVDFGAYDNDGPDGVANSGDDDGYVDIVALEFLEVAASCGGPAIWPHRWAISGWTDGTAYETDDPAAGGGFIRVDDYITQSVADCSGLAVQDASTISHEFGHVLGLPDFYHPTVSGGGAAGRRWILGCWALMAGGSWGCGTITPQRAPYGPVHMSAYSKHELGWLDYVDVGEVRNAEYVLDPVETSGRALRIPLDDSGRQFLIAEYRAHTGLDAQLPADGVLLYKLDLDASLRPDPASGDPYFLSLVEQDGNDGLVRNAFEGGNRGEPGDAWGVGGAVGKLNAMTTPPLRRSDGAASAVAVHEVSVEGGTARLVVSTAPTPEIVPPAAPFEVTPVESFVEELRIAGGTMPYGVRGDAPDGTSLWTEGDELWIQGSVREAGPFELVLVVTDALDHESAPLVLPMSAVGEWAVSLGELLQSFLESSERRLSDGETDYLDDLGNRNGRYDVGDLRGWLREHPPAGG